MKVKLFGQEIEQFGITSDDKTITSDVISDYINTQRENEEVGISLTNFSTFEPCLI